MGRIPATPAPAGALASEPSAPAPAGSRMGAVLLLAVLLTLGGLGVLRLQGQGPEPDAAPVLWQRQLHFLDRPGGDIGVVDAASGREVARFEGEQGFVRGALRTLVRERKSRRIGPEQPFELTGHPGGRLSLRDPATGTRISLESFGPANAGLFAQLGPVSGAAAAPMLKASAGNTP